MEDPRILWDSIKGFITSNTILFSSNARKSRSLHLQSLEREFSRLDSILQSIFTEQVARQRTIFKKEIDKVLKRRSEFQIHRNRQKYYFNGARTSHLLALRVRVSDHFADIPANKLADGNISTDPKQINSTFQTFCSKLHKTEVSFDKIRCDTFFKSINLPQLPRTNSSDLEKPILLEELQKAAAIAFTYCKTEAST